MATNLNVSTVDQIFSGINYLEALSKVGVGQLVANLSTDSQNWSGGSVHSADADSIFNKFSIFKYSKFINGAVYQPQAHFIGYVAGTKGDPNDTNDIYSNRINAEYLTAANKGIDQSNSQIGSSTFSQKNLEDQLKARDLKKANAANYLVKSSSTLANPTASNIIKWSSEQSMESVTGFQPYAMSDFMFCMNYGKIPNNRLITIRRYPFPIDDLLRAPGDRNPIPIAQAVTWFGEGTDNILSNIGVMNWGLRWDSTSLKLDEPQIIDGNEVTVDDLLGVFSKIDSLKPLADKIRTIYVGLNGNNAQLQQISKIEAKLQDFARLEYTATGPYWNRIYGPVNVINATTRRARGMQDGWAQPFNINFHYKFRTFNGLSPKIVALDLLSSFLNLTYNDAQFLPSLGRYFPKLGLKFDPTMTQMLGKLLTEWGTRFDGGSQTDIIKFTKDLIDGLKTAGSQVVNDLGGVLAGNTDNLSKDALQMIQSGAASLLADAIPKMMSIRSALSDRPIGEWHMVVGNPMNPIMVMGDLVCMNCLIKFDEELGPDDFPTGCTFTLKLAQGKPRDKVAIERMFNLGEAKMMYNKMRNPSSASDTFDEPNNTMYEQIKPGMSDKQKEEIKKDLGSGAFEQYRGRIRKTYKYTPIDNEDKTNTSVRMDDSLLWLYFDRHQEKM